MACSPVLMEGTLRPPLLKLHIQQNPWLTIANKQLELMHKFLSELGLSPVARGRVSIRSNSKPWEFGSTSKFVGLLGGAEPDEFFGDRWRTSPIEA